MTYYKNTLFADWQVMNRIIDVKCNRDYAGNPIETDVLQLLLKKDYKYIYNVEFLLDNPDVVVRINDIQAYGNGGSTSYSINDVLIRKFTVDKDCSIEISYCL